MAAECDRCGACCKELIIEIEEIDVIREPRLVAASEPFRAPEGMTLEGDDGGPYVEVVPGYGAGAMLACGGSRPCPMLGADHLCGIYPTRPNVCVAMRPGSVQCEMARGMAGLPPLGAAACEPAKEDVPRCDT